MPLKTRVQKAALKRKLDCSKLIKQIESFQVPVNGEMLPVVTIEQKEKKISVSHPNYAALTREQKNAILRLKNGWGYYIQWEFFLL